MPPAHSTRPALSDRTALIKDVQADADQAVQGQGIDVRNNGTNSFGKYHAAIDILPHRGRAKATRDADVP